MNKSESTKELFAALAKFQGLVSNPTKNKTNSHFKSGYADLAAVTGMVQSHSAECGLAFVQMPSFKDGFVCVETIVTHESGEWISETASCEFAPKLEPFKDKWGNLKQPPSVGQQMGILITYLRRYSLAAFAGISQQDDDGNDCIQDAYEQGRKNIEKMKRRELSKKQALAPYPDEDFQKNKAAWTAAIKEDSSKLNAVIDKAKGFGFSLSPEQIKEIL